MRALITALVVITVSACLTGACTKTEEDDEEDSDPRSELGGVNGNPSSVTGRGGSASATRNTGSAASTIGQETVMCVGGVSPQPNAFCPRNGVCSQNASCSCVCDGGTSCRVQCDGQTNSNSGNSFNFGGANNAGLGGNRFAQGGGNVVGRGGNRFGQGGQLGRGGVNSFTQFLQGGSSALGQGGNSGGLAQGGGSLEKGGGSALGLGGSSSTRNNPRSRGGGANDRGGTAGEGGATSSSTSVVPSVSCLPDTFQGDRCSGGDGACPNASGCFCIGGKVTGTQCPAAPTIPSLPSAGAAAT